jgi:hypothetical protein
MTIDEARRCLERRELSVVRTVADIAPVGWMTAGRG